MKEKKKTYIYMLYVGKNNTNPRIEMKKQQRTDQHNKCNKDTCMIMFQVQGDHTFFFSLKM